MSNLSRRPSQQQDRHPHPCKGTHQIRMSIKSARIPWTGAWVSQVPVKSQAPVHERERTPTCFDIPYSWHFTTVYSFLALQPRGQFFRSSAAVRTHQHTPPKALKKFRSTILLRQHHYGIAFIFAGRPVFERKLLRLSIVLRSSLFPLWRPPLRLISLDCLDNCI